MFQYCVSLCFSFLGGTNEKPKNHCEDEPATLWRGNCKAFAQEAHDDDFPPAL